MKQLDCVFFDTCYYSLGRDAVSLDFYVSLFMAIQSVEEMVAKIFATRRITRADQSVLMAMFAGNNISANDKMLINQIYDALNQGRLRVVE